MITLPVYDKTGAEVGKYEIDPRVIAPTINRQLLHDAVVMYLANKRQGSNKTKSRGQVAGSTKKLYRQKGTGNARVGSRRPPHRRGGGHAHARTPRSYYYRLPKKAIRLATRMAIASKFDTGQVVLVNDLTMDKPQTKEIAQLMSKLGIGGMTTLIATEALNSNLYMSSRNIPGVDVSPVTDLNALTVLKPKRVIITTQALDMIKEKLQASAA